MTIYFKVNKHRAEIGTPDFLKAFFSTISYHLEEEWGERYPLIMNDLYQGDVRVGQVDEMLSNLAQIRQELAKFTPDEVVWDIDDEDQMPPWGQEVSPEITSLANYFVTSAGEDLFEVLIDSLKKYQAERGEFSIEAK